MTYPAKITEATLTETYTTLKVQALRAKDTIGRDTLTLRRFSKPVASYTWAIKEQAFLRD